MRKQVVIPKIALQIAGSLFVNGKDLRHIQSQVMEMLAESEKGLVFFNIIAKGANKALVVGDDAEIISRRARFRDGQNILGRFSDGTRQFC